MAGNKKSKRKPSPKVRAESLGSKMAAVQRGIAERQKRYAKKHERNVRIAQLPMGHPMNSYVLDLTFGPLYKMFDDQEKTGTHLFTPDGDPVMWVERDQCYTPIIPACIELHEQFEFTASEFGWGDMPCGLLAYGLQLMRGERQTVQDIADASAAVQWMRERLESINCIQWAASMRKMAVLDMEKAE